MKTGLLLFAHGARDARWAQPFEQVAAAVRAARPDQPVRLAFLEFMTPDIRTAAGHVRNDLPPMLDELRGLHGGVAFNLHPAIGETSALVAAIAGIALSLHEPT